MRRGVELPGARAACMVRSGVCGAPRAMAGSCGGRLAGAAAAWTSNARLARVQRALELCLGRSAPSAGAQSQARHFAVGAPAPVATAQHAPRAHSPGNDSVLMASCSVSWPHAGCARCGDGRAAAGWFLQLGVGRFCGRSSARCRRGCRADASASPCRRRQGFRPWVITSTPLAVGGWTDQRAVAEGHARLGQGPRAVGAVKRLMFMTMHPEDGPMGWCGFESRVRQHLQAEATRRTRRAMGRNGTSGTSRQAGMPSSSLLERHLGRLVSAGRPRQSSAWPLALRGLHQQALQPGSMAITASFARRPVDLLHDGRRQGDAHAPASSAGSVMLAACSARVSMMVADVADALTLPARAAALSGTS